jgi:uroporphyrinogen-III synthase
VSGRRVLVTRPEPGAARTAARLQAAGYEPVVMPLSKIVALRQSRPSEEFGAVAASSANALRHAYPGLVRLLSDKPLFAVGDETASAAREAGFADVRSSRGSAEDLARAVASGMAPSLPVAYLCGRFRRDVIEAGLGAAGIRTIPIETYDTHGRKPTRRELAALDSAPIGAALVYSALAARALASLVRPRAGTIFGDAAFIAISDRVAERLASVAQGRVFAAASPDEDAMFELLAKVGHEPAAFPADHG